MTNSKDILTRLQNGENIDDIADEMIKALNAANDQFQKEEEEKAKKAEHEAHLKETRKIHDLQEIIDLIHDFCITYYCETEDDVATVQAAFATFDAESVNKMIDEAGAYAVKMAEIQNHFDSMFGGLFDAPTVKKLPKKSAPAPETKTADAVIDGFLASIGLK